LRVVAAGRVFGSGGGVFSGSLFDGEVFGGDVFGGDVFGGDVFGGDVFVVSGGGRAGFGLVVRRATLGVRLRRRWRRRADRWRSAGALRQHFRFSLPDFVRIGQAFILD